MLVATSNAAPDELYRDGLNRGLFVPFIAVLKASMSTSSTSRHAADYRLGKLAGAPVYVTPLGPAATAALDRLWRALTGTERGDAGGALLQGAAHRRASGGARRRAASPSPISARRRSAPATTEDRAHLPHAGP